MKTRRNYRRRQRKTRKRVIRGGGDKEDYITAKNFYNKGQFKNAFILAYKNSSFYHGNAGNPAERKNKYEFDNYCLLCVLLVENDTTIQEYYRDTNGLGTRNLDYNSYRNIRLSRFIINNKGFCILHVDDLFPKLINLLITNLNTITNPYVNYTNPNNILKLFLYWKLGNYYAFIKDDLNSMKNYDEAEKCINIITPAEIEEPMKGNVEKKLAIKPEYRTDLTEAINAIQLKTQNATQNPLYGMSRPSTGMSRPTTGMFGFAANSPNTAYAEDFSGFGDVGVQEGWEGEEKDEENAFEGFNRGGKKRRTRKKRRSKKVRQNRR
jgi:hypothetical protein